MPAPTDLIRLVHGVSMAMQYPQADDGQADRMIGLIVDGLRVCAGPERRECRAGARPLAAVVSFICPAAIDRRPGTAWPSPASRPRPGR